MKTNVWLLLEDQSTGQCCSGDYVHVQRPTFFFWVPCTVYETRKYFFHKNNFKTESHSTIHTFKNYFTTIFSIFNFQFLAISDIQTDLKCAFGQLCVQTQVPYTVHETHKPLFSEKFSLKIGPTTLFTYLKIILLQCFQFSIISSIQTNPNKK